jgi:serine/threonine protein kinase, bacterial
MMLVSNRYRVVRDLGQGGFGTTSLVEDTQLPSGRRCVLKELGNLTPQIPSLYAYFSENNKFYLVQEYIEGETIAERLHNQGPMSDAAVREWLSGLLNVLSVVHDRKIIHRDIKPENVILRQRDHKPVLIDFGAVRETMGTRLNANGVSTQSIVIGTPGFMSSEQAAGRAVFSSDLYSLGLTAIYALTGKIPQELPTEPMTGNIQWRSYAPSVSAGLARLIDRAIAPNSNDRFQTAHQMLDELLRSESPTIPEMGVPMQFIPAPVQNPIPLATQPPVETNQYPPTIIAAHDTSVPPQSNSPQTSHPQSNPIQSPMNSQKQDMSTWAKAMITGGVIGTFVLIGLFITRPQPTAQVDSNATAAAPSPKPTPSVTPTESPVAAVSQNAPSQSAPTVIIQQAAAPAAEKPDREVEKEVEKQEKPEKQTKPEKSEKPAPSKKDLDDTNAVIVGQAGSKNIRSGPGTDYKSNHIAYPGNRVRILERGNDSGGYTWYKVYFPESGADGWIAGQLLRIDQN